MCGQVLCVAKAYASHYISQMAPAKDSPEYLPKADWDGDWVGYKVPLRGWEPWTVLARVEAMPDGTVALVGLRIEPRDDYDGSMYDQQLTATQLRSLPVGALKHFAAAWFYVRSQLSPDEAREPFHLHLEASHAQLQSSLLDEYLATVEEGVAMRKQRGSVTEAHLFEVSALYKLAERLGESNIRLFVAEHAGMSIRTVDRRLADARRTGLLPPYRHAQGKHGKSPAKESRNE